MDTKFWVKLSKKEKIVASVAIIFVSIAIFDRVILEAILSKTHSIEQEIKMQEMLLKKNRRLVAQKDVIAREEELYANYAIQAKSQEEEIAGILKEIESLAGQTSVNLFEIKPANLKAEKLINKYSVSLVCEATMEQLVEFMFQLELSKNLFTIESYGLTLRDKEKGILRATILISKIVIPSGEKTSKQSSPTDSNPAN